MRVLFVTLILLTSCSNAFAQKAIQLPAPDTESGMSVRKAIYERRSVRGYENTPLTIEQVSQLLWAAGGETIDGITGPTRAYPSAGASYPLEIYLVAGNVEGLDAGLYHYNWKDNTLSVMEKGDLRAPLAKAAYGQGMITAAPATIVVTAIYEKATSRYGDRGRTHYVPMDAGHLGQNVHLEAHNLGLGTVMMAGFKEKEVADVLKGVEGTPVYMMPVGEPRK